MGAKLSTENIGDSMEPKYHERDTLYVKESAGIENGGVGAFETENGAVLKQGYKINGEIELCSYNSKYEPLQP